MIGELRGGFVDLHLHLLPGVDDGPPDLEAAVEMANMLVDDGVEAVAVTPHFNAWNPELLSSTAQVDEHVLRLRAELSARGVALAVFRGAEHFLTPDLARQLAAGTAPKLANGPYVLIELPFTDKPLYADDVIFQVALTGATPVLAHPERYAWVQKNPSAVTGLVDRGVALQLTAAGLLGHYGQRARKTAEVLLTHNAYSLVGSDLHRADQPRRLSQLYQAMVDLVGEGAASILMRENPRRVLQGDPLIWREMLPITSARKGFFARFGRP